MDTVTVNVSGQVFKASKAVLKRHSGYFDERFSEGRSSEDLSGVSAEVFAVLLNYMTKSELNLSDMSCQLLSSVQDAARFLGLSAFPQDLERVLKSSWCQMKDLHAVLCLAARLGVHGELVRAVIDDVLKVLLRDKDKGVLREQDLSYEVLIFAARLDAFWETLTSRCKYAFAYEAFFESAVSWMVKSSAVEANVDALVSALKVHTVPWKFLADCASNASGLPEMRELLKFSVQKRQEEIRLDLNRRVGTFRLAWHDAKQGSVVVQQYNCEKFGWDEKVKFSRLPLVTERCLTTRDYVYALGDQTLTSVRLLGSTPFNAKFPERLEVVHCFGHRNSLFIFAWNRRDHVIYEYAPERREFLHHGPSPMDANMAAASVGDAMYIAGENLRTDSRTNRITVWMLDFAKRELVWTADLRKSWCIQEDVQETASNPETHLVPSGNSMYALVQERQSTSQTDLYAFRFSLETANTSELEPCKLTMPTSLASHSYLACARECGSDVLLLFRSATRGEYSLAVLDQNRIYQVGFLPTLPSGQCLSLEHAYLRSTTEQCDGSDGCPSARNSTSSPSQFYSINTLSRGNSTSTPYRALQGVPSASEETLVKDETDLNIMRSRDSKSSRVEESKEYRAPRMEDLQDSKDASLSYGNISRASSRRSSIGSAFSRASSMRSSKKDGKKKKGFGSKALSVMAGLVS